MKNTAKLQIKKNRISKFQNNQNQNQQKTYYQTMSGTL